MSRNRARGKASGEETSNKELETKIELVRNFSGWSNREDILRALEEAGNDPQRAISYIIDGDIKASGEDWKEVKKKLPKQENTKEKPTGNKNRTDKRNTQGGKDNRQNRNNQQQSGAQDNTARSTPPTKKSTDTQPENTPAATTTTTAPVDTKPQVEQVPTKPTAAQIVKGLTGQQQPQQQQQKKSTQETVKPTTTTPPTTSTTNATSPVSYSRVASGNTSTTNQPYNKTWKPKDSPPTSSTNTPAPVTNVSSTSTTSATTTPTTPAPSTTTTSTTTTTTPSVKETTSVNTTPSNTASQAQAAVVAPVATPVNATPVATPTVATTTTTPTTATTTTPVSTSTTSSTEKSSHSAFSSSPVTLPAKATVLPLDSHFSEFHFGTLNISNSEFDPHYNPTPSTSTTSSEKHTYDTSRNADVHGTSANVGNTGVAPGTTGTATGNVSFGAPYLHGSPFLPSAMYHPFAYAADPSDNSLRPFMTMYDASTQQAYQAALYQQREPSPSEANKFNPNTASSTANQSSSSTSASSGSNGTTSPTPSQQQQQQNPFGYASMYPAQYPYMASQYASYQATGPSQYYRPPAYIRGYPPNYTASSAYPTGPSSGNPLPDSYSDLSGVPMPQEFKNTVYPMTTSYYPVSGNPDVSQMLPPSAKPPQHQLPSQQSSSTTSGTTSSKTTYSSDNASYNNSSKSSQNSPQDYKNYQQSGAPNYYMPAQQFGNQPSQTTASSFAYGYPTRPQQYNQQ